MYLLIEMHLLIIKKRYVCVPLNCEPVRYPIQSENEGAEPDKEKID